MTTTKETTTTSEKPKGRKPDFYGFIETGEGDNKKSELAGSAWKHKDGKGFNIILKTGQKVTFRGAKSNQQTDETKTEAEGV